MRNVGSILLVTLVVNLLSFSPARAATDVVISEFMAANNSIIQDEDGEFSDWIELYNASAGSINLAGWALTDDAAIPQKWIFPSVSINSGEFLLVFASSKNRAIAGSELHTNFKLTSGGEYLGLTRPGLTVAHEYSPDFPNQQTDVSYGILLTEPRLVSAIASADLLVPPDASLGSTWTGNGFIPGAGWFTGNTGVSYGMVEPGMAVTFIKSEVSLGSLAAAETMVATPAQQTYVTVENRAFFDMQDTSGGGHYSNNEAFPSLVVGSNADRYVTLGTGTLDIPSVGDWTFGVNSDDGFSLVISNGVETFTMEFPNTRGANDTLQTFNFTSSGPYGFRLLVFENTGGSSAEFFAAQGAHASWNAGDFDLVGDTANGGLAVFTSAGGGTAIEQTNVETALRNVNGGLYLRIPFTVNNVANVDGLRLDMRYNDGFVAYLNGVEIASRNAPGSPAYNALATATRTIEDSTMVESINVDAFLPQLVNGGNVLAIHGLNDAVNSDTFLVLPELVASGLFSVPPQFFNTPTPGTDNTDAFLGFVKDTSFTVDRGFYSAPFNTTIASATPGATIVYTLNGSTPSLINGTQLPSPVTVPITGTTTLRAAAYKTGYEPSDVDTHTYIFVADVLQQSPNGELPTPEWPTSPVNGQVMDYGMDPNVINDARYTSLADDALLAIPSLSIVTDLEHFFDLSSGIYANPGNEGAAWERPASLELVDPDGSTGFQINAGIRIRGGFSRSKNNPKHSFRFFFSSQWGDPKLDYPLFGSEGADEFDKIDLRTPQNYSWAFQGNNDNNFGREVFARDTQREMGEPYTRSRYYHLYINGVYWGMYMTQERSEARFSASYFGGDKDDYDVIKAESGPYDARVTDGNITLFSNLWAKAMSGFTNNVDYFEVLGKNPDGTDNPAFTKLVDRSSLFSYMIGIFHSGDRDAPISNFTGNQRLNNHNWSINRVNPDGFKCYRHDGEHTFDRGMTDRTGPWLHANFEELKYFNPQTLHERLTQNLEYRVYFGDQTYKAFFNDGVLTINNATNRFLARMDVIDISVIAESIRWGDAKTEPPKNRDDHWLAAVNKTVNWMAGNRIPTVIAQLRNDGWYPNVEAPLYSPHGGAVAPGFMASLSAGAGTIYYTTDGSDPRMIGGAVRAGALTGASPISITINETTTVKARVLDGGEWSPLNETTFYANGVTSIALTELMYNPADPVSGPELAYGGGDFEYIEFQNTGASPVVLTSLGITEGIDFDFADSAVSSLAAGDYVVVVRNLDAFKLRYTDWASMNIAGVYSNSLSNGGEQVAFVNFPGQTNTVFTYNDAWYPSTDGGGFSLTVLTPQVTHPGLSVAAGWRSSYDLNGSPGGPDSISLPDPGVIVVNEVLTHQDVANPGDWIELHNTSASSVDISGWYLSDSAGTPLKFEIPVATSIGPGGYRVFTQFSHFGTNVLGLVNGFGLSEHGDDAVLSAPNGATMDIRSFDVAENGVTFGRYTPLIGTVQFPALASPTYGAVNSGPKPPPLAITEIMYNPPPGFYEFVELQNTSGGSLNLYDPSIPTNVWSVAGIGFDFPTGVTLAADEVVVLIEGSITPAAFRTLYAIAGSVKVYNFSAGLSNGGEQLRVRKPLSPDETGVPFAVVDAVVYDDVAPWPTSPDGGGASLERDDSQGYGNDAGNWTASVQINGTPGSILPFRVITPSAGAHGTISPAAPVQVPIGGSQHFTFAASNYYHVANVTVNGVSVGAPSSYTLNNVTGNKALHVTFAPNVAAQGTPHWWLNAANPSWVDNFDVHEASDLDGDGVPTHEEFGANSHPNDITSKFELLNGDVASNGQLTLTWNSRQQPSAPAADYAVYRADGPLSAGSSWTLVQNDIPPTGDLTAIATSLAGMTDRVCVYRVSIAGNTAARAPEAIVGTRIILVDGRNVVGLPFVPADSTLAGVLDPAQLPAGATEAAATVVDIWDQDSQTLSARYWLSNASGFEGWRTSGSFTDASAVAVDVTKGLLITLRSGMGPVDLFLAGYVPEVGVAQSVASTGYTLSAVPFPGETSLYNADLIAAGFTGGNRMTKSDNVLLYNEATGQFDQRLWYYTAGNLWLNPDASPTSRTLAPGEAFLILRRDRAGDLNWTQPVPYPVPVPGP